jgi:thiosulfate/3-mercaptopyruvate sulfurtransferase
MTKPYTTLIQAHELQALMASGQPLMVFDCSFDLMDPAAGPLLYAQVHIPGAAYMHLDDDLSTSLRDPGRQSGGRHPLPSREGFAHTLTQAGLTHDMQVVVYDRQGCTYCGRLWWMLKWCGHEAVAVLDGGLPAWLAAGGEVATWQPSAVAHAASAPTPPFNLQPSLVELWNSAQVAAHLNTPDMTLIDARATPRYRGDVEPLDPVAGHIPGAYNRPFADNFGSDGRFKSAAELRAAFDALLEGQNPASVVHHCGSGVTATANVLAMELAGLGRVGLFSGSWSEWCNTPDLPCASGPDR